MNFDRHLQHRWYSKAGWLLLLWPLELIYRFIIVARRCLYQWNLFSSWRAPVPVIVVGNISVGGTGKTPVTIALCELLQRAGYKPGVISRGYRAQPPQFPYFVRSDDSANHCGDEPLLIAKRTRCPIVIAPRRVDAARHLLDQARCDVIICDDGLQHYALQRDIEIVVVDAARGFGNGHCLPCGPLREPVARLQSVDAIILNGAMSSSSLRLRSGSGLRLRSASGSRWLSEVEACSLSQSDEAQREFALELQPSAMVQLSSGQSIPPRTWCKQNARVHAVAGIGNPERFFTTLRALGCDLIEHAFPDHHDFRAEDLSFDDALPIVMTEKDAMKCTEFATDQHWYLQVRAQLPDSFAQVIFGKLNSIGKARIASPFN